MPAHGHRGACRVLYIPGFRRSKKGLATVSQHDIEDLVEDSIRSVLASDHDNAAKRRLAARLYRFQYLFDTSDTYGRLKPQLEAIGFVEDQADEPPLPLLDAVAAVIASDDRRTLVHDWVALLARSIDDGDARDEVPAAFSELAQDASALAIRAAAVRHGVGSMRWGKGLRVRRIPWATYARDYRKPEPAQVDRQYGTRFFADFEPSVDALLVEHATDLQASQARVQAAEAALQDRRDALAQSPLQRLPALVVARNKALTYLGKDERGDIGQRLRFIFRIDGEAGAADGTCYHLLIQHEPDLGHVLMPFIGVQSGTVRSWQGRPLGPSAADMHFVCDLDALVPQARQDEDRQLAKGRIGWRYKATESETVLGRRLDGLLAFLPDMLIGVRTRPARPGARLFRQPGGNHVCLCLPRLGQGRTPFSQAAGAHRRAGRCHARKPPAENRLARRPGQVGQRPRLPAAGRCAHGRQAVERGAGLGGLNGRRTAGGWSPNI